MSQDTIFALSSGLPPAGIAVVRLSGPAVRFGLETLIGRVPQPRKLVRMRLSGLDGEVIDHGLVVFFPRPGSVTGEDVAEFHVHGGRAVLERVMGTLASLEGFRLAERGEFTRRALEAGKIDLVEVEGLADLVAAETEVQRRQALRQAEGSVSRTYDRWRERLTVARGMIEAEIDFADGEDLPAGVSGRAWDAVRAVRDEIAEALADADRGERLRDGIEVVILGPPNVGKSTLLNWFARKAAAIVSPEPGTTRDLIEVRLDLGGYPLTLTDTAGLRETGGLVEQEGMRRALARAATADIILWLADASAGAPAARAAPPDAATVLRVLTKIDLLDSEAEQRATEHVTDSDGVFPISGLTGAGLEDLARALLVAVEGRYGGQEPTLVTRQRHADALRKGLDALDRAMASGLPLEIAAEELRTAGDALTRVTGRIDVEDLLDTIFAEFCIGK